MMEDLREASYKKPPGQLVDAIISKTKYKKYISDGTPEGESRWENVKEFLGVAKKFNTGEPKESLNSFLEEIALFTPNDETEDRESLINLMTLHSAKGLEFPVVFIAGCEEGLLPHARSIFNPSELEEERRLCYVGITRAKNRVFLIFTHKRTLFGSTQLNLPSRFLADIPTELVDFEEQEESIIDL